MDDEIDEEGVGCIGRVWLSTAKVWRVGDPRRGSEVLETGRRFASYIGMGVEKGAVDGARWAA